MNESFEWVDVVVDLAQAIGWPVAVIFVAFLFRRALRGLLSRQEVALTGPAGIGITARRTDCCDQCSGQGIRRQRAARLVLARSPFFCLFRKTAEREVEETSRVVLALGRPPRGLWVDDRPSNNRYETAALEALGMSVDLSTSTDDALTKITAQGPYDVIISDMGRPPDKRAGYTLLERLRRRGDETAFIIYAASRKASHFDEEVRRGRTEPTTCHAYRSRWS